MKIRLSFIIVLLSLAVCKLSAVSFTVENNYPLPFQNISISYSQAPVGSRVVLYQDAALLPLIAYAEITDETATSGVIQTMSLLEPARYRLVCEQSNSVLAEKVFTVSELGLIQQKKQIAVMTDVHVMAKSLLVSAGSAFQETLESDRKMLDKSEDIFAALIDSMILYKPDLLVITGDLTKDGELISHRQVVKELNRLKESGVPSLVIPGNHDLRNPFAYSYDADKKNAVSSVEYADFAALYADFGYAADAKRDPASLSYCVEPISGLVIIGIDATRADENTTSSRQDYGRIRKETLQWIFNRADEAVQSGKQVIALQHHQLIQHYNGQASAIPSAAIENGDSIALEMLKHGIRLVLTGHMHIGNNSVLYNEDKTDSIVEISTGAPVSYPVPYRYLSFNENYDEIGVQTRYLHSLTYVEDLLVESRNHTAARSDNLLRSLVRQFSPKMDAYEDRFKEKIGSLVGTTSIAEKMVATLPKTASGRADMAVEYFSEPFRQTLLLTSEGNENRKLTDTITSMAIDGVGNIVNYMLDNADFNFLEQLTVNTAVKPILLALISEMRTGNVDALLSLLSSDETDKSDGIMQMIHSVLDDCSYCGTDNENITNDLFITLSLPTPQKNTTTALENTDENGQNSDWYDVLGRKCNKPIRGGVYINNGKKMIIR